MSTKSQTTTTTVACVEPPFSKHDELEHSLDARYPADATLPGQPRVQLSDGDGVSDFLKRDLCCNDLELMSPHLWLVSTPSFQNVTPLHRQSLRWRRIVVMEDPGLHMVWIHDCIFLKALPAYLLSHTFWTEYLLTEDVSPDLRAAALGYLRTYYYLVGHESDLRIAQQDDLKLVPKGVTFKRFCDFSARFLDIDEGSVSGRYAYGELRLTRLNILVKALLMRWSYQDVAGQYSDYFARFYGPLLFFFAFLSILLNAMQVALQVESLSSLQWHLFWDVSRWFAISCIFLTVAMTGGLLLLFLKRISDEVVFAVRKQAARLCKRPRVCAGKRVESA